MREIIFNFTMQFIVTLLLGMFSPESQQLQEQFIEKAVEAGEKPDFESAYNYYGYAYWEGSMDAKREMENILKSERDRDLYNFKFDKMCPSAKDDIKTNHIRLLNGDIVENNGKIKRSDLEKSSIVFNDKNLLDATDYYIYFIVSDKKYNVETDSCFDFAINMAIEKGHEYKLKEISDMFNDNNTYSHLSVGFISEDDYNEGKLPEFIDFEIER